MFVVTISLQNLNNLANVLLVYSINWRQNYNLSKKLMIYDLHAILMIKIIFPAITQRRKNGA